MATTRPPFPVVNLANAFLAGPWTLRSLVERGKQASPNNGIWIRQIVRHLLQHFGAESPPPLDALVDFLLNAPKVPWHTAHQRIGRCFFGPATMAPRGPGAASWQLPALTSAGQLADWLGVAPARLDWLADIRGWNSKQPNPKLQHYVCRWQPRKRGRFRLIESPKAMLKKVQRQILHAILDRIPPHPAAHGFRRGRSILSYAAPHVGQDIVLRFDLRDFFPTVPSSRVHALFRVAGYPDELARLLTGLCTARVPVDIWEQRPNPRESDARLGDRLRCPHLPQGAPTSPALANLCAYRLDVRLHALAHSLGATYTRYADDLAFSGGELLHRSARRVQVAVAVIATEEGFDLHLQKSRFMRRGVCQQLAGIVVNDRPNLRRAVFDELKAILTNCARHGPHSQNRAAHADFRSHLLGRIAHLQMIHPQRGTKLRAIFDRIVW